MPLRAKVVVAYLDGRRAKGFSYDFSAMRDHFFLFPEEAGNPPAAAPGQKGEKISLAELKGVFFVKDFAGDPARQRANTDNFQGHGRKLEVTFADGETLAGATQAYNPGKVGFFMFPADAEDNNDHIFVINKNVKQVRFL
jgi:hypothetical protein